MSRSWVHERWAFAVNRNRGRSAIRRAHSADCRAATLEGHRQDRHQAQVVHGLELGETLVLGGVVREDRLAGGHHLLDDRPGDLELRVVDLLAAEVPRDLEADLVAVEEDEEAALGSRQLHGGVHDETEQLGQVGLAVEPLVDLEQAMQVFRLHLVLTREEDRFRCLFARLLLPDAFFEIPQLDPPWIAPVDRRQLIGERGRNRPGQIQSLLHVERGRSELAGGEPLARPRREAPGKGIGTTSFAEPFDERLNVGPGAALPGFSRTEFPSCEAAIRIQ